VGVSHTRTITASILLAVTAMLAIETRASADPPFGCSGDATCDGFVDVDDLLTVINGYGECDLPELNNMMSGGSGCENEIGPEELLEALEALPGVTPEVIDTIKEMLNN
jgi:hypothetical protein